MHCMGAVPLLGVCRVGHTASDIQHSVPVRGRGPYRRNAGTLKGPQRGMFPLPRCHGFWWKLVGRIQAAVLHRRARNISNQGSSVVVLVGGSGGWRGEETPCKLSLVAAFTGTTISMLLYTVPVLKIDVAGLSHLLYCTPSSLPADRWDSSRSWLARCALASSCGVAFTSRWTN